VSVGLSSPLAAAAYPNAALRAAINSGAAQPRRHQRSRTAYYIEAGTTHRSSVELIVRYRGAIVRAALGR
jgi:hypothetical protein